MAAGIPSIPAATAPPVASVPSQPAAAPAAPPAWYDNFKDPELKGYIEHNKLDGPEAAVRDAWNAQKLIGIPKGELVRVPKADGKPEEWDAVYNRLGRPNAPTDYKLPQVEGGQEFATTMAPILHKAGLNQSQVDAIATGWNAYMTQTVEAQERAQEQRETLELQELHREWPGEVFTQREEMGRRAIRQFVNPIFNDPAKAQDMVWQIEQAIGTGAMLKLFANIGEKVGEANTVGMDNRPSNFGMTPAAAKARLAEIQGDREFGKKIMANPKGPEAQEWNRVIEIAARGA